ncbi:alpha/beta-hydrolase [Tothia fuscella]|uniref:Carboxylic ester hydrolase n=1 Tax=Tothia fuscella TaxID=1048955 RepID=A0A9P4U234_9PEZI|nr:alpha/beta-hydrolase [Tothia fuscella]
MSSFHSVFSALLLYAACNVAAVPVHEKAISSPAVTIKNGTCSGLYSPEYNQDYFLGIPFAQPPVGDLRFRNPQHVNSSFAGTYFATKYSSECIGYTSDQWNYQISEDCLYLNVVRPAGYENTSLPVAFWIHGGGYIAGGGLDQRYNLSFIVQNSVRIGKPMIGVSINYRLSAWGFLSSLQVSGSGNTNMGLKDQRLALRWVQENIAAFGGDTKKVTIWGESAGASSVGLQLTAYGGRDDNLFRAAIMQSGNPVYYNGFGRTNTYQSLYDEIITQAGCANSTDSLQCLRGVTYGTLNAIFNGTTTVNGSSLNAWGPVIDGDFIQKFTSLQLQNNAFVHVPILSGANSDEGTAFSPTGINSTEDFYNSITSSTRTAPAPAALASALLDAYPDDPSVNVIASLGPNFRPGSPYGAQYRRSASYYGDLIFIANRRLTCQVWAAANVPAYCYRFNTIPAGVNQISGVTHFQEIGFVFLNTQGVGYPPISVNPFTNKSESFIRLAMFMDSSWISFVSDLDPNAWRSAWNGSEALWPVYDMNNPQNIVFDANVTSYAEPDTYRDKGMRLINQNNAGVYNR